MADRVISIRITSDGKAFVVDQAANADALAKTGRAAEDAGRKTETMGGKVSRAGKEAKEAANGSDRLAEAVKRVGHYASGLLGVGLFAGWAGQVIQAVDAVSTLESRLKLVTAQESAVRRLRGELYQVAQETRSAMNELGNTYATLAKNGQALGYTQERLLVVSKAVGQALAIGGGSAQGQSAALVQLSQGLASGTLRGEELNSVLEQTPRLAQAIADGMGITVGQLRAYGQEGKISALAVLEALEKSAGKLDSEFARVKPTISSAYQVGVNAAQNFIGKVDEATDASARLAGAIIKVADGVDALGRVVENNKAAVGIIAGTIGGAAAVTSIVAIASGVAKVASAVTAVGVALTANPAVAILLGVGVGVGALASAASTYNKTARGLEETITALEEANVRSEAAFQRAAGRQAAQDNISRVMAERRQQIALLRGELATLDGSANAVEARRLSGSATTAPFPGAKPLEEVNKYVKLRNDIINEGNQQAVELAKAYENRIAVATSQDQIEALRKEQAARLIALDKQTKKQLSDFDKAQSKDATEAHQKSIDAKVAAVQSGYRLEQLAVADGIDAVDSLRKQDLISEQTAVERKRDLKIQEIDAHAASVSAELALVKTKKDSLKEQAALDGQLKELAAQRVNVAKKAERDLQELAAQPQIALLQSTRQATQAIYDQVVAQEAQNTAFGKAKYELVNLTIAQLDKSIADLEATDNVIPGYIEALERQREAHVRLRDAIAKGESLDAGKRTVEEQKKAAEASVQIWRQKSGEITDALIGGFSSVKSWIQREFGNLVLRPFISPIAEATSSFLGYGGKAVNAAGVANNGYSLWSNYFGSGATAPGGAYYNFATSGFGQSIGLSNAAPIIGNNISAYAPAGTQLAGAGSAASGFAGAAASAGAIAIIVSAAIDMYRDTKGEKRSGGAYGYDASTGRTSFLSGPSGGDPAADANQLLIGGVGAGINATLAAIGSNVRLASFQGAYETSDVGRGGVYSGGRLSNGVAFGESGEGTNYGWTSPFDSKYQQWNNSINPTLLALTGFTGRENDMSGTPEDLAVDVQRSLIEVIQASVNLIPTIVAEQYTVTGAVSNGQTGENQVYTPGDITATRYLRKYDEATKAAIREAGTLPKRIADLVLDFDPELASAEAVTDVATKIGTLTSNVTAFRQIVNSSLVPVQQLKDASFDMAASLIEQSGSAEKFASDWSSFIANYYTDAEKSAASLEAVTQAMTELGYGSITTREEFREAYLAIDKTTEAGAKLSAQLLALNPAFAATHNTVDALKERLKGLNDAASLFFAGVDAQAQTATLSSDATAGIDKFLGSVSQSADSVARQQIASANAAVEAAREAANQWRSAQATIESAIKSIRDEGLQLATPQASYAYTKANLAQQTTAALNGDAGAADAVADAAKEFIAASASKSVDRIEYLRDRALAQIQLTSVLDKAKAQVTVQEAIAAAGEQTVAQLEALNVNLTGFAGQVYELLSKGYAGADRDTATAAADKLAKATTDFAYWFSTMSEGDVTTGGQWGSGKWTRLGGDMASYMGADGSTTYLRATDTILEAAKRSPELRAIWEQQYGLRLPSYSGGSAGLPSDGPVMAHKGEKIIDPMSSAILNRYGIQVRTTGGGGDDGALLVEFRAMRLAYEADKKEREQMAKDLKEVRETLDWLMRNGWAVYTQPGQLVRTEAA
ncbi:MAG: tape measure protein [Ramlibacter sp.]|nr:tape measure protein [Ramlibacter sp.]